MPDKNFLFDLLGTPSPSGWEADGQRLWIRHLRNIADAVEADAYGNAWATLDGTGGGNLRVLIEAHADEIGFIVRHIDAKGFLSLAPIGWSDRTIAAARRIRIFGDRGEVPGVIGNNAIHLRDTGKDKVPEWKDLFADVGASSAAAVEALGIRVGHPAIYCDEAVELSSGRLIGRAIDNRISGFLLAEILSALARDPTRPYATTIAANAIQEEIGHHGARMIAHRLKPHVAVVFDVTHATDTPGLEAREHGLVELGKGPTLSHGAANHPLVVKRLLEVAQLEEIPVQHEAISCSTRTDADAIYTALDGVPSALVSIPMRYMHSPTETVDLVDADRAARLVAGFVRSLRPEDAFQTI